MRTEHRRHRLARGLAAAALVIMTASSPPAHSGDVWSFEDCDGVTHLSNVPDNARYRLLLSDPAGRRRHAPGNDASASARAVAPGALAGGQDALPFAAMVAAAASEQGLDPALLHAIIHVESRHNPAAVSAKGAIGLMQILPDTARRMGVAAINTPAANIGAGARYLRFLLDIFDRNLPLTLAAYNAGENAVLRYGRQIPPYAETRAYVPAVLAAYHELRQRKR